jgi:hypothetical protein
MPKILATRVAKVGRLWYKTGKTMRLYLKKTLKAKGLGAWLKW